jgi:hypothetical protein
VPLPTGVERHTARAVNYERARALVPEFPARKQATPGAAGLPPSEWLDKALKMGSLAEQDVSRKVEIQRLVQPTGKEES